MNEPYEHWIEAPGPIAAFIGMRGPYPVVAIVWEDDLDQSCCPDTCNIHIYHFDAVTESWFSHRLEYQVMSSRLGVPQLLERWERLQGMTPTDILALPLETIEYPRAK